VLHDTIEDTRTTAGEIEEHFGRIVHEAVEDVTDDKGRRKRFTLLGPDNIVGILPTISRVA
jgi:hypothetical protein